MGKNKFKRQPGATLDDRRKVLRDARKQFAAESAKTKTSPQYNVDQLLDKAEDCINRFEYEIAQKFCQRALEIEADNIRALETTGTLLLELGNPESAKQSGCMGHNLRLMFSQGRFNFMFHPFNALKTPYSFQISCQTFVNYWSEPTRYDKNPYFTIITTFCTNGRICLSIAQCCAIGDFCYCQYCAIENFFAVDNTVTLKIAHIKEPKDHFLMNQTKLIWTPFRPNSLGQNSQNQSNLPFVVINLVLKLHRFLLLILKLLSKIEHYLISSVLFDNLINQNNSLGLEYITTIQKKPNDTEINNYRSSFSLRQLLNPYLIHAKYNVDQLLDKTHLQKPTKFEYELAQKFCQRALEIEADNRRALETTGTLLLELGNPESAKQLFEGAQAVEYYQKGIELMLKEKKNQQALELAAACGGPQSVKVKVFGRENESADGASVYWGQILVYVCSNEDCGNFEEDAESKCKTSIEKAIDIDQENPEGYQLMASFLLSKDEKENAEDVMKKRVSLLLPKFKALDKDLEDIKAATTVPLGYDARISTTKILIEVDEHETAIDVAEGFNARYYLEKCKKLCAQLRYEDEELLKHVDELLFDIGPGDEDEEDDGKNEQEEIEIESDSDEENMEH
ncbi:Hypothetical predicted protein [Mytilus galloprovincialis]|uniref:Uncharacterized protein n=1 Tax=Mytilus galloprovincialis TaxID=29158 RepID=A0A8B6GLT6_MYTGA|nr:Hypothetical predicted protein [Mytilus galloprovincialis]